MSRLSALVVSLVMLSLSLSAAAEEARGGVTNIQSTWGQSGDLFEDCCFGQAANPELCNYDFFLTTCIDNPGGQCQVLNDWWDTNPDYSHHQFFQVGVDGLGRYVYKGYEPVACSGGF